MQVIECDLPPGSALSREMIGNAYFHDSYRAPLTREGLGIVEVFFALFGHTPIWMKLILIVRNAAARVFGLEAPTFNEIMKPTVLSEYRVGDKIGPWPIFFIAENEIVAGRNNKHLDFRVSVLRRPTEPQRAWSSQRSAPCIMFSGKSICSLSCLSIGKGFGR